MSSQNGADGRGEGTLAERAVRRRLASVEESAQADVQALMDAGLALMVAGGGERRPRVADIVAAAGLSNDSFYRYFAGKDALVEAIVEQGARAVVSYVRHRMSTAEGAGERLRAGVTAVMKQASDEGLATQTRAVLGNATSMSAGSRHMSVALVESLAGLFTGPVTELGADDPARTARAVAGAALAGMQYHLFKGETPDEADLGHLVSFLLAGMVPASR
ncbi:TetR/AcrR family transcriptional regulator [Actinocorallia sp. B10E7]|uniref:TetR/AcrR family transcriptional regulator n=1 Tax=Actinocorallia sp. B10E7 TaxID=3153558 RepID=UPI00325C531B